MQTVSRKQDDHNHLTQAFGPGRRRPKGLHAEIDFRGNPIWTYREGHGPRIRINETFGTQSFEEAYFKARLTYGHADAPVAEAPKPFGLSPTNPASLAWLIDQFLRSPGQRQMAEGTQKQRRNVLGRIAKKNPVAFSEITDDWVSKLQEKIAATGKLTAANAAIAHLRLAFDWAVKQKHVAKNPCLGVEPVKYKGGTNHVWTDVEASRFEQAYPLGTRERLAYALLLYTGQRGVDVVKMGLQHIHDGSLKGLNAQKTGKPIDVPVLPVLQEAIDACNEKGDLIFLIDPKTGAPFNIERFGRWFRAACDAANVPSCTPHGLRHLGATRLATNGCKHQTLQAIYGWSMPMAVHYTQQAEHTATAKAEIHLLVKRAA